VGGEPLGKIDDLELTEPPDGGAPVLTALLCGPTALAPRIGGRLGAWWGAIGRRLRPTDEEYPNRIPIRQVASVDRFEVRLTVSGTCWTRTGSGTGPATTSSATSPGPADARD
jgi:hypothetical protein